MPNKRGVKINGGRVGGEGGGGVRISKYRFILVMNENRDINDGQS